VANTFKNAGVAIGTTQTLVYQAPAGATAVIHAIYISNINGTTDATVDVQATIDGGTTFVHLGKTLPVPADSTLLLDKPVNLEAGDKLVMTASAAGMLEVFVSIMEIT